MTYLISTKARSVLSLTWAIMLGTALSSMLGSCNRVDWVPIQDAVDPFERQNFSISGEVCTSPSEDLSYPLRVLFVVDGSVLTSEGISEAEQTKIFFNIFGVDPNRLIIKEIANNTYQESIAIAQHLKFNGGVWVLVTSALHMPRAITLMQSRDIGSGKILPYSTDFKGIYPKFRFNFNFDNIDELNSLIHELVGIVAYRITGRTKSFLPNLENIPVK